jgi:hypothetical protein
MRKGQMVFEFMIAAVLFFSIVIYVISYLNTNVDAYATEYYLNDLENKAVQISELLVHNRGYWESDIPYMIGAEKEWPVLNRTRIADINRTCNEDYVNFLRRLDLEEINFYGTRLYKVRIVIDDLDGETNLMDCGMEPGYVFQNAYVQRIALSDDNNILKIGIWVWG